MKLLDLFAGIGGISLGAHWAGIETVGFCEIDPFCQKILKKHWPNVPIWPDVKELTGDEIREACGAVDIIAGGFPCQPYSVAGKRRGEEDDRALWPEMLRVISELKPTWVLGENVPGIVTMALEQVCTDLENEGYEVQPLIIPAAGVGALHRRKRVFILGYSEHNGLLTSTKLRSHEKTGNQWGKEEQKKTREFTRTSKPSNVSSIRRSENGSEQNNTEYVANAKSEQGSSSTNRKTRATEQGKLRGSGSSIRGDWWQTEPNVGRVANGVPSRVDRLRGLGNAVVPQQIYPIFKAIMDIENGGA